VNSPNRASPVKVDFINLVFCSENKPEAGVKLGNSGWVKAILMLSGCGKAA
jgi:hypothetical protein